MDFLQETTHTICIEAVPYPWAAPRVTRRVSFNPKAKEKREYIRQVMKQLPPSPFKGAISLRITFYMQIPQSWTWKRKLGSLEENSRHTKKPDLDNCVKALVDSLKKLVFDDDNQVFEIHAKKEYAEKPRIVVHVTEFLP